MESIKRRPILGYGLGSFESLSAEFFDLEKGKGTPAHNVYVELLVETGIFGLLAYVSIYAVIIKTFFRRIFRTKGALSTEAAIVFSYVVGYLMVCFSDNALYYLSFNWYFWFFLGVVLADIASAARLPAAVRTQEL